jgi:hypothetical protein
MGANSTVHVYIGIGPANGHWKGGKTVTKKGYIRITHGLHIWKYEHRVVVENLPGPCALNRPLRSDEEVHHIDFNRGHNCPGNLLLLDEALHHGIQPREKIRHAYKRKSTRNTHKVKAN